MMAELFATSKQSVSYHIINILKDKELDEKSVVKEYLTTAADGKNYNVVFYYREPHTIKRLTLKKRVGRCYVVRGGMLYPYITSNEYTIRLVSFGLSGFNTTTP